MSTQDRTETSTSPALELAGLLYALAEHLVDHPHLPNVNIEGRVRSIPGIDAKLQIATYPHFGELKGAAAVLQWAKSFANPTIMLTWNDIEETSLAIHVESVLDGRTVRIWTCDHDGDLRRWHTEVGRTPITLDQLAAYVAAGTVEHADEIAVSR